MKTAKWNSFKTKRTNLNPVPVKKTSEAILPLIKKESDSKINALVKSFRVNSLRNTLTVDLIQENIDDYSILETLGHGAYSIVKYAIHRPTGRHVALKIYQKSKLLSGKKKISVKEEIALMKSMDHPNIVKLYQVMETDKELYLVMELINGTSLFKYIQRKPEKRLKESECAMIFSKLISAIKYCHKNRIIHRDIKMENIMITDSLDIKLIDFGFSVKLTSNQRLTSFCGTPSYVPPEVIAKKVGYGVSADIWSLGILLYAMLCGSYPFKGSTEDELYCKIQRGIYNVSEDISSSAKRLIHLMLKLDPTKRINIEEISRDPFFILRK